MRIQLAIMAVLLMAGPVAAWDNDLEMSRRNQEAEMNRLKSDMEWQMQNLEIQRRAEMDRLKSEMEWRRLEQQQQMQQLQQQMR